MEALFFTPTLGFVNIGERCNVTGSRRFAKLIKDGAFEQAVEVAKEQAKAGAQIIDVNMDEAMLDGLTVMPKFLNMIGADPEVAKVSDTFQTLLNRLNTFKKKQYTTHTLFLLCVPFSSFVSHNPLSNTRMKRL
jgi:hypothetical protein